MLHRNCATVHTPEPELFLMIAGGRESRRQNGDEDREMLPSSAQLPPADRQQHDESSRDCADLWSVAQRHVMHVSLAATPSGLNLQEWEAHSQDFYDSAGLSHYTIVSSRIRRGSQDGGTQGDWASQKYSVNAVVLWHTKQCRPTAVSGYRVETLVGAIHADSERPQRPRRSETSDLRLRGLVSRCGEGLHPAEAVPPAMQR